MEKLCLNHVYHLFYNFALIRIVVFFLHLHLLFFLKPMKFSNLDWRLLPYRYDFISVSTLLIPEPSWKFAIANTYCLIIVTPWFRLLSFENWTSFVMLLFFFFFVFVSFSFRGFVFQFSHLVYLRVTIKWMSDDGDWHTHTHWPLFVDVVTIHTCLCVSVRLDQSIYHF